MFLEKSYRHLLSVLTIIVAFFPFTTFSAESSGGITLNATRIVYPQGTKQLTVPVRNTSGQNVFLVQTWVDDVGGNKSKDFIVTPPLFTSNPESENTLRLMYSGGELPKDRESLYYFSAKGIPSVDRKAIEGTNSLILATITRIKLFVRPAGLRITPTKAPEEIRFRKDGNRLQVINPTPYYLTLVNIKAGREKLEDTMVSPFGNTSLALPSGAGSDISFSTINDYGAVTTPQKGIYQQAVES